MAKAKGPPGGKSGGAGGGSSAALRDLAIASKQQVDILNRLLAVARFGPTAGGGGLPGKAGAGTPEDRARAAWEDRQRQLYDRAQALSQVGAGAIGRGIAGQATLAQGMGSLGVPGAGVVQRFAGVAGAAKGVLDTAGRMAPTLHDSFTTGEQKARTIFRDFVPGGETLQGYYDNFSGRQDAFERAEFDASKRQARTQGRLQEMGFGLGFNPQQAGLDARAGGLRGASPVYEGALDRSTASGEKEFRDRQRLIPIEREIAKAERETAAASAQRLAATKEQTKLDMLQNQLARERKFIERQLDRNGSGSKRQDLLNQLSDNESETAGVAGLRQQAAQNAAAAKQAEAEARFREGSGRVGLLRGEADNLEGDAAEAAGGARRVGMMDRFSRAEAIQNLKLVKAGFSERLDPSQVQSAMALAPNTVGKILEKQGAASGEFKALREIAPEDYAGDPEGLRRKAQEKRDEAVRRELELERTVADAAAASGKELGKAVVEAMRETVQSAIREILTQVRLGKNKAA